MGYALDFEIIKKEFQARKTLKEVQEYYQFLMDHFNMTEKQERAVWTFFDDRRIQVQGHPDYKKKQYEKYR